MKGFVVLMIGVVLFFSGCEENSNIRDNTSVNIGAIFPMTGGASMYGKYFENGAKLALVDAIDNGRISNSTINLIIADGKAKTHDSVLAFEKLSNQDNIQGLLVDLSSVILATKSQINKNSIPSINSSSFGSQIEDKDDYMFSILPNAEQYATKIASYAYTKLDKRKAAVVYRNDAMGASFVATFETVFKSLGGQVVVTQAHRPGAKDYSHVAENLKKHKEIDIIFLASYGVESARLLKKLSEINYDNTYITFQGFLIPDVFKVAGKATENVYIIASSFSESDPKMAKLKNKLEIKLGSSEFNYYTAAHYDAMNIFISAVENGNNSRDSIREYIKNLKDFQGITGKINFNKNGLADMPLSTYKINDSKFIRID